MKFQAVFLQSNQEQTHLKLGFRFESKHRACYNFKKDFEKTRSDINQVTCWATSIHRLIKNKAKGF